MKLFCKRNHDILKYGRDVSGHCKRCEQVRQKVVRTVNKVSIRNWHKQNYMNNKETILQRNANYRSLYRAKIKQQRIKRNIEYPEIEKLRALQRNKQRALRIVKFGQEGIKAFYRNCPERMVVDHTVPLCGRKVSGLHVVWNLQYLTIKDNSIKHNQFDGTLENNSWRLR